MYNNPKDTYTNKKNSKDQQIVHQSAQNKDQQKRIIIHELKYDDIQINFEQLLKQLYDIKNIPNNVLQQYKVYLDELSKLIQEVQNKINSLKQNSSQQQNFSLSKGNEDAEQIRQKKQEFTQAISNQGDSGLTSTQTSIIEQEKQNIQQKNVADANLNQQNKPQSCIIDLQYAQNNQSEYQFMLYLLMEQNLKVKKLSLSCLGNVNVKRSDLTTLSNKNQFDSMLNQQLQWIFSETKRKFLTNERKVKVLGCSNIFCSFQCFENAQFNNLDNRVFKFYCPLCDEYSVV